MKPDIRIDLIQNHLENLTNQQSSKI
jgi:hypothetical protein